MWRSNIRVHSRLKHILQGRTCLRPWGAAASVFAVASSMSSMVDPALGPWCAAISVYVVASSLASSLAFMGAWWLQMSCVVGPVCAHGSQQHLRTLLRQARFAQSDLLAPMGSGSIRLHSRFKHALHSRTCLRPRGGAASMDLLCAHGVP
jgi:hypothetical protein